MGFGNRTKIISIVGALCLSGCATEPTQMFASSKTKSKVFNIVLGSQTYTVTLEELFDATPPAVYDSSLFAEDPNSVFTSFLAGTEYHHSTVLPENIFHIYGLANNDFVFFFEFNSKMHGTGDPNPYPHTAWYHDGVVGDPNPAQYDLDSNLGVTSEEIRLTLPNQIASTEDMFYSIDTGIINHDPVTGGEIEKHVVVGMLDANKKPLDPYKYYSAGAAPLSPNENAIFFKDELNHLRRLDIGETTPSEPYLEDPVADIAIAGGNPYVIKNGQLYRVDGEDEIVEISHPGFDFEHFSQNSRNRRWLYIVTDSSPQEYVIYKTRGLVSLTYSLTLRLDRDYNDRFATFMKTNEKAIFLTSISSGFFCDYSSVHYSEIWSVEKSFTLPPELPFVNGQLANNGIKKIVGESRLTNERVVFLAYREDDAMVMMSTDGTAEGTHALIEQDQDIVKPGPFTKSTPAKDGDGNDIPSTSCLVGHTPTHMGKVHDKVYINAPYYPVDDEDGDDSHDKARTGVFVTDGVYRNFLEDFYDYKKYSNGFVGAECHYDIHGFSEIGDSAVFSSKTFQVDSLPKSLQVWRLRLELTEDN